MQGNNELQFNLATMNEAIEFYLNEKVLRSGVEVKVKSVEMGSASISGGHLSFQIKVESPPVAPDGK